MSQEQPRSRVEAILAALLAKWHYIDIDQNTMDYKTDPPTTADLGAYEQIAQDAEDAVVAWEAEQGK